MPPVRTSRATAGIGLPEANYPHGGMRGEPVNKRPLWVWLALLCLLVGGVFLFWRPFAHSDTPRPLAIHRTALGRIPRELLPGKRIQLGPPTLLTDLNGDGEAELVMQLGYKREARRHRTVSLWTDLQGKFLIVPAAVIYPKGDAPILKELIAFSEQSATLRRLRLEGSNWQEEFLERPAITLSEWMGVEHDGELGLSLISAHAAWLDRDGDGAQDVLAFALPTGKQLYLTPAPEGHWQYARFTSAPAFSVESSQGLPLWAHDSTDWGWLWCGDADGDGAPDKLNRITRRVRLSQGDYPLFPEPSREGEAFLHANLDGQAPDELVYIAPMPPDTELRIYRYQNGAFTLIAQKRYSGASIGVRVYDLNGDGVDELLVASQTRGRGALTLSLLRLQNRTLHETPRRLADRAFYLETPRFPALRRSAAFRYDTQRGLLSPRTEVRTALIGFPPPSEEAMRPTRWRVASGEGIPIWAGDYDGDGNEEYVLSHPQGGVIAQFREGAWRIASIRRAAPIAAAVAVKREGKPVLILIYADGVIESVEITR